MLIPAISGDRDDSITSDAFLLHRVAQQKPAAPITEEFWESNNRLIHKELIPGKELVYLFIPRDRLCHCSLGIIVNVVLASMSDNNCVFRFHFGNQITLFLTLGLSYPMRDFWHPSHAMPKPATMWKTRTMTQRMAGESAVCTTIWTMS